MRFDALTCTHSHTHNKAEPLYTYLRYILSTSARPSNSVWCANYAHTVCRGAYVPAFFLYSGIVVAVVSVAKRPNKSEHVVHDRVASLLLRVCRAASTLDFKDTFLGAFAAFRFGCAAMPTRPLNCASAACGFFFWKTVATSALSHCACSCAMNGATCNTGLWCRNDTKHMQHITLGGFTSSASCIASRDPRVLCLRAQRVCWLTLHFTHRTPMLF